MKIEAIESKLVEINTMTDRVYILSTTSEGKYRLDSEQFLLIITDNLLYIENILNELISLVY